MQSIEEKYLYTKSNESVINKDWAAGSKKIISSDEYIFSYNVAAKVLNSQNLKCIYKKVEYSPAWLKAAVDEPLVNAIDHFIRNRSSGTPVTTIKVDFDQSGAIKIYNDGPGVEIEYHS